MVPIAIETRRPEAVFGHGQYKEQASGPKTYVKQIEQEGTEDQPAAKVRVSSRGTVECGLLMQVHITVSELSSDMESCPEISPSCAIHTCRTWLRCRFNIPRAS